MFQTHVAVLLAATALYPGAGTVSFGEETVLHSFEGSALPNELTPVHTEAALLAAQGNQALAVDYQPVDWPNVRFNPADAPVDWSYYTGLAVDIHNPGDAAVRVGLRVDNEGADGANHCVTAARSVAPGARITLQALFRPKGADRFWGMRGVPVLGPIPHSQSFDPSKVTEYQVFLFRPPEPHRLVLDNVRLIGKLEKSLDELVPFPFVDRFGQYKYADWPGKVDGTAGLKARAAREAEEYGGGGFPGRDEYGGWADGPQLEATGWFRTERIDGKWWLVTPSGHLFFSIGMDCVGTWQSTFVEKRAEWFDWLPAEDNPLAAFYGYEKGAHSGAEPIGGQGRTYSFYRANLYRKYGEDWAEAWRRTTYKRLQAWGFNTIANWSQGDVIANSPMPYVVSTGISGDVRRIDAGGGYWSHMVDVYDPGFVTAVDERVAPLAKAHAGNPLCIGYFVDNEISWGGVRRGTLASPPEQPCRKAFIEQLKAKYGGISGLNEAWGTQAETWDALRNPGNGNEAFEEDMTAFEYAFARRYFETIRGVLKEHAPNQLYLGSRFSVAPRPAVRAAGDVADVVSFNRYEEVINPGMWTGENALNAPLVIGEFHFGALDRGMFHTGLVEAKDQQDRARKYINYLRSVAECPAFVGCHWFQYVDEPNTGRWFDGENYNIGFVNVTDTPYPEMAGAAKQIHREVYPLRYGR